MMELIDSHCHLHLMGLEDIQPVIDHAYAEGVTHFLCVSVNLQDATILKKIARQYDTVFISVGEHPDTPFVDEFTVAHLVKLADFEKCIAIGETGLDYFRVTSAEDQAKQRKRFEVHIAAAIQCQKPLIIHTREAAQDTLAILKQCEADKIGGVMHCFTETYDVAKKALDLGFYISFSGIVTFKNASDLQEVAKKVPLERILIETDCPYLAPVPFRGKQNQPAYVRYVAEQLAALRQESLETIAQATTANFYRCFRHG